MATKPGSTVNVEMPSDSYAPPSLSSNLFDLSQRIAAHTVKMNWSPGDDRF